VLRALRAFYRATRLNRVAYVNNWLIPTQPTAHLDAGQVRALTRRLTELYPSYAVLFKGIEPQTTPALSHAVAAAGYETIAHRPVYFWDPKDGEALRRSHLKRDLGLLKRTRYRVGWAPSGGLVDSRRLRQLYSALYEEKHSRFNLQYTEAFFSLAQRSQFLAFFLIEEDGQIDGFSTVFRDCTHLTASITGYDPTVPRKEGLYRIGQVGLIRKAMDSSLLLNLSAGADSFKMLRGARPRLEYEAVYARHLPLARRLPWRILPHVTRSAFKKTLTRLEN
jgi:Acetyltransferase (GNAT) domain